MTSTANVGLVDIRALAGIQVVRLPAVIRGQARMPAWPRVREVREAVAARRQVVLGPTTDGAYLLARPIIDRLSLVPTGDMQIVVVPAPEPRELLEPDPSGAILELLRMPFEQVCQFVDAVGEVLAGSASGVAMTGDLLAATSTVDDRLHRAFVGQLPRLFDGAAVRTMVQAELGTTGLRRLDDWVAVPEHVVQGVSARMAANSLELEPPGPSTAEPLLRAVPTTQLHITAGNTPAVPVTSLLWGWATKGACVLKPAAEAAPLIAAIGTALAAVDPAHPLARHTTLAYWRGGDALVEDVLLDDGAFDRRVVWGSTDTVQSVTRRGGATDTLVMRPRHAVSLIGRAAVQQDLAATVRLAAVDSMVADQQACMSSLLHLVEGTDADADAYARSLADVLARWDAALPHRSPDITQGRLLELRRGLLASADWHLQGRWPDVTSAVARIDRGFDLDQHPGGRLVLVRAVADLESAALALLHRDISHVGVAPTTTLSELRDILVGCGVDNVLPLGEAERSYAGRPQDGMMVLNRLVRWVNA